MRIAIFFVALAGPGWVAAQQGLITNGDFAAGTRDWNTQQNQTCTPAVIESELQGVGQALRLHLRPGPGQEPWSIQLSQSIDASMAKDDRLRLTLWMRSPESCRVTVYVQENVDPWPKFVVAWPQLTPEWQEYELTGACPQDYGAGETQLGFHLGHAPGTIDIADVRLVNLNVKPETARERPSMERPINLIVNGDFSGDLDGNWGRGDGVKLKLSVVDADLDGVSKAVRVESEPTPGMPAWDVQLGQACTGYVDKGDVVFFRARVRSPDACRLTFIYELATAPHTKAISQTVKLTPEWQEYRFAGTAGQHFRPGESQAKFFLGYDKGVVEIANVHVENCGPGSLRRFAQTIDYWAGREHPDTWRAPALERIERIRKEDLTVRVVDANDRAVAGAKVSVKQLRHGFRFGTALGAARLVDKANPDNLRFQQEVERLFNTVTFENDLKYVCMSDSRLATVDAAIEWLKARDIEVRGHCLLWGAYKHLHGSVKQLRGTELREACEAHVREYAKRMAGRLYLWDVVNEAGSNVELWDDIGWDAFAGSFRWAREADPNVRLCYNDYGIVDENPSYREKVAKRIKRLLDGGAPVEVLGIQAHMRVPLTPIHRVLEILDEWADFGLPLEITELDLGCFDDDMHGSYVRDFMLAAFSHPKVESIIMWGFWEGSHWRAKDGAMMFSHDWTKRPAQLAYEGLILNQWWTNWTGQTSAQGIAQLRAFHGRHQVTAELNGTRTTTTIELTPQGTVEATLKLPAGVP